MDESAAYEEIRSALETGGLAEAAVGIHEMFLSLKQGGFGHQDALYIIAMGMFGKPRDGGAE